MNQVTLLVLAAGMGSRYGGLKQLDPVGPNGETVIDYSVFDAIRAGFSKVVFVIREEFSEEFKKSVGNRFVDKIAVEYAYQNISDLPDGFNVPEERIKPWGTGHAILAASGVVNESFAVINADDFYGKDAYTQICNYLIRFDDKQEQRIYCMVGYPLRNTLSENGSVSRGICSINESGQLESVKELTKIVKTDQGPVNMSEDGESVLLDGAEIVSMNMWGFTPDIFVHLERLFTTFLEQNLDNLTSEFYIPFAVDSLIATRAACVDVLQTTGNWFGVTYQEDKDSVQDSIRLLIKSGEYPLSLS
ncbi:MAG: nucleotidyltransferase [Verrucomicrobiaceae bacterium]|nr:nucleotidyltransferase [Verrucomicrobiaceae bacterium]